MVLDEDTALPIVIDCSLEGDAGSVNLLFISILSFILKSNLNNSIMSALVVLVVLFSTCTMALLCPFWMKSCNLLYLLVCLLSASSPNTRPCNTELLPLPFTPVTKFTFLFGSL